MTVTFQIWKTPFGSIGNGADAFITFDNTTIFLSRIPNGSTQANPYIDSSLVLDVAPGDTIDFGTTDLTRNGISDVTGFTAEITEVTPAPLPSSASTAAALLSLLAIASAVQRNRVKV